MSKTRDSKNQSYAVEAQFGLPGKWVQKIVTLATGDIEDYTSSKTSPTSSANYAFFKPELNKRKEQALLKAKELLTCVLHGDDKKVLEFAQTNPALFFIKVEEKVKDYAMDLEGNCREIEGWSPYQAIFGTGDKDMLEDEHIKPTDIKRLLDAA